MKGFEILGHTADVKIRVFGKTKDELFFNALVGMAQILKPIASKFDVKYQKLNIKNIIKISSLDLNTLLVDFLNEVLYNSQINRAVYREVKFIKFSDTELEAEISGEKVEEFNEDIKAVTHHGLDIKQNPKGYWEATVLFDI